MIPTSELMRVTLVKMCVSLDWFPAASLMAGLLDSSLLCSVCCWDALVCFILQELLSMWCWSWGQGGKEDRGMSPLARRLEWWASKHGGCSDIPVTGTKWTRSPWTKPRDWSLFCSPGENAGSFKGDEQWWKLTSPLERAPSLQKYGF